jgi:hypothetical protein
MSWKDKLNKTKQKMQEQIQRGREITEQQRAEKLRRKADKIINMKPGAKRAIVEGFAMKSKPWDVARNEYVRRKHEREKKYHNKDEDDSG